MLEYPSISVLGRDPAHRNCVLNGNAFQQDTIQSFNGWQYAAFYSYLENEKEPLYIHLSRRKLPRDSWETLVLKDYPQTTDDGHNTVQHIRIRYRHSQTGVATTPEAFTWDASLFTGHLSRLPGLGAEHDELLSYVTYPRFVPLGQSLLFSFRTGKAGLGDDHLAVYSPQPSTPTVYGYTLLGTNLKGIANNPYIHGLSYRGNRLHATWVYRGFVHYEGWDDPLDTKHKAQRGPNSADNNYDICYAYSDDGGLTWRNGAGALIADLGRGESVRPDSPGITAFEIPKGKGLTNQEAQAVDSAGGVHVLNRDALDGEIRWKHYYRSPEGVWTQRALPYLQGVQGGHRGRLAVSQDDSLYLILPETTSPGLTILKASNESGYAQYERVWRADAGYPPTEPLVDTERLGYDNVLSVFTRASAADGKDGVDVVVLDFKL
ncbi:hypothetical protein AAE478_009810 [Parahypoxylon ruwenzoriense]